LIWGALMGVFGLFMKFLSMRDGRKPAESAEPAVVSAESEKDKLP